MQERKSPIGRRFTDAEAGEDGAHHAVVYEFRLVLETVDGVAPSVELVIIDV